MEPDRRSQVSDLYHAALQRPVADRSAYLREACGGDETLRQEVESLLRFESDAFQLLERPAAGIAGALAAAPVAKAMVGQQIGPYRIVAPLGAGGMGEVYRAHDSKLGREVAIKILPAHFTADPERRARFAREARVLATLNHPNIGAIYGLEDVDGITALVLELDEGPTLADRLERGPLKVSDALAIARQIAEALEAAHEKGIVHRDLKPANIILQGAGGLTSSDARVKVLDFGLAKLVHADPETDATPSGTLQSTEDGRILGTPGYMSPEQARGLPIDKRTDIWGFGCVLFEMLTGQRAFTGETLSDVLVRIIEHEPDWHALPVRTPAAIRRLLHRCLEKDPRRRLDSAAVVRIEIDEAAREPTPVVEAEGARRGSLWRPIAWAATGAGVAVLVTMVAGRVRPTERPAALAATSVFVDAGVTYAGGAGVHFAVAPNGRTVVFPGNYAGRRVLYRRDLDRVDPEPLVGTDGGSDVFFSHDGRWLGFERASELWTASLDGGTPQRLLPNQALRGGTWGEGDRLVLGRVGGRLWTVSTSGAEPRQLTNPTQGERHEQPQMLPGGRAVLFTILAGNKPSRAAVHLLETGETRDLFEGVGARFVGSGHVVFGRQERLWAVGFDADSLQTLGEARPVRDDVVWSVQGYPQFAVGAGLLAYVRTSHASSSPGPHALTWIDRKGGKDPLPLEAGNYGLPRLSPEGDRLVVGVSGDLWTYDLGRGMFTKLTSDRIVAHSAPAWTPDGSRVLFTTWFDGEVGLGRVHRDGSSPVEEFIKGAGMRSYERTHPVMLPDGSGVIMTGLAPGTTVEDLLFVPLAGERRVQALFQARGVERNPAIAPNGRFIAYNSDESGRPEVCVRPFPNVGSRKVQISTEGGAGPVWTRRGSEIVYVDSQGWMVAVAVRSNGNDEFDFSKPERLFKVGPGGGAGLDRSWDVTANGQRFIVRVPVRDSVAEGRETAVEMILIQNWTEELKRLVPREPQ